MSWEPDPSELAALLQLFRSLSTPDSAVQAAAYAQLKVVQANPLINVYLAHILIRLVSEAPGVRVGAGLLLKNNLKQQVADMAPDAVAAVKGEVLQGVADGVRLVRQTAGTCVATLLASAGGATLPGQAQEHATWLARSWPSLVPSLVQCLDSGLPEVVDGALSAIAKIFEHSAANLASDETSPLDTLFPKLLALFGSPEEEFRSTALASTNMLILLMPASMAAGMNSYLAALFALTQDPSPSVRRHVCSALTLLVEVDPQSMAPHLTGVLEFVLHATQDADGLVALQACEFWTTIAHMTQEAKQLVGQLLPRLVPVLLAGMCYAEGDAALEHAEDVDEHVADRPEDVKPILLKKDGEDDDGDGDWNLRKCSATSLEECAKLYKDDLLPVLLPLVQQRLQAERWEVVESGILALGAISEGCDGMWDRMHELSPFLLGCMSHQRPLVRTIACWSLRRYSGWVAQQDVSVCVPILQAFLTRCLDSNKKVQESACSAFATLAEYMQADLIPYTGDCLAMLVPAFDKYQLRSMLCLYDAVAMVAECSGQALNQPQYVEMLMPKLIAQWNELGDADRPLLPLFECLMAVATALGEGFGPFTPPVFGRCVRLVNQRNAGGCPHDAAEFATCALDMLSAMADTMQSQLSPLIQQHDLATVVLAAMQDQCEDVRRAAFALCGDLARFSWPLLQPSVQPMLSLMLSHLDPYYVAVCANAAWAIGEVAMKAGAGIEPAAGEILSRLLPILNEPRYKRELLENAAIALGRVCAQCPAAMAPHMGSFLEPLCCALRNIDKDHSEKADAFVGLIAVLNANPEAAVPKLGYICEAMASWRPQNLRRRAELLLAAKTLLHSFKSALGPSWDAQLLPSLHPKLAETIVGLFFT